MKCPAPYDQQLSIMQTLPTLLPVEVLLLTASHRPPSVPDEVPEQNHRSTVMKMHESEVGPPCRMWRRRIHHARFNDSSKRKRHRKAVKKYSKNNPEVNRKAVKKLQWKNSVVHIRSVKNYGGRNPEVHRASVSKHTEKRSSKQRSSEKIQWKEITYSLEDKMFVVLYTWL